MTDEHAPPPTADVIFDIWFMPMAFWTQWWRFYAETLNVARFPPGRGLVDAEGGLVDVEVEEGLVA
ncbi:hypothetical protein [Sphingobium sp. Z007]|uniref:hypothetical protein n=1 Tax=Sphingobium sp. Z007 TaxID=627495 RepID=UPI000B49FB56|nr:hypothetical protein [Sphingobium sp. Z007]